MIRMSVLLHKGWLSVQQSPATSPPMIRISVELQKGWLSVLQSPARASHQWWEYLLCCTRDDCLYNRRQLERHQWSEYLVRVGFHDCLYVLYNSHQLAPPTIRISVELLKGWLSVQQPPARGPPMIRIYLEMHKGWMVYKERQVIKQVNQQNFGITG